MEESGHYYTVYITSLAVGFSEPLAYQHATITHRPRHHSSPAFYSHQAKVRQREKGYN